ncbi:hypothetical protein ACQQ2Q_10330 [Agrobacterium sp. ES01]|uniref:hypothetical protein n=1 Tax=Agrobacterium sp. ES01 TaxID=3420714 RepID=UPI003D0CBCF6
MAEVTSEMLYEDLLKLDARAAQAEAALNDLVSSMKDMNKELTDGQVKTEELKRKIFKNRVEAEGALIG